MISGENSKTKIILLAGIVLMLLVFSSSFVSAELTQSEPLSAFDKVLNFFGANIIPITGASHLDSSRNFISDIYEQVKAQDNNWSEPIPSGEFVRVTFEENLTSLRDITIYARNKTANAKVEIYTRDGTEKIAEIGISKEGLYKTYLTGMNGSHDVFDLKSVGDIEFDYIVDPLAGYSYKKNITILNTYVDANLTDFPLLVAFDNDTDIGSHMIDTTNYYDIRFTDTSDNVLAYEMEYMNISSGKATGRYWVKVPTISNSSNTTIYVYYGKSGDTDGSNKTGVWDSNFVGVWHVKETGTNPTIYDSTTNSGNSSVNTWTPQSSSKVGPGGQLVSGTDHIEFPDSSAFDSINTNNAVTVSMWINWTSSSEAYNELLGRYGSASGTELLLKSNGKLAWYVNNAGNNIDGTGTNTLVTGTWYYVSAVYSTSGGKTYVDGAQDASVAYGNPCGTTNSVPMQIGHDQYGSGRYFRGYFDEARISNIARSAAWIKFEFYNMNGTAGVLSFGGEEGSGGGDTTYPIFSSYWDNNASLIGSGIGYFNVTINNTNGTVWLDINNTNITATNLSANVYNVSYNFTSAGNYNYTWFAYGNGTSKNLNNSGVRSYTVNSSVDTTYPIFSNYWDNNATLVGSGMGLFNVTLLNTNGTVWLNINNTNITATNLTANVYNVSYNFTSAGTYSYTWYAYGNGTSKNLNNSGVRSYTVNSSVDTTYPIFSNFQTSPANNSAYLPNQLYQFNSTITNTNGTAGIEFNSVNYSMSNLSSVFNKTLTDLSAGTYTYYFWAYGNGTSNNYNVSSLQSYTIAKAGNPINTLLNGVSNNLTVTYPQQINISVSGNLTIATILLNGTSLTSGTNYTIGAGVWTANVSAPSNQNYSGNESSWLVTINQATSSINLTLNNSQSNISIYTGTTINLNCSTLTGDSGATLTLYNNGTIINSGTSPIGNATLFSNAGMYNITCYYLNSQNYSTSSQTFWVNATLAPDTTYPIFSNYWDNNATLVGSGMGLFNVTVANTNGTVWLNINNTNITATNLSANVYNVSYNFTLNGTYSYTWYAYGNGTSKNLNNSGSRSYTVLNSLIAEYSITSSLTSGETAVVRARILNSSEISSVWVAINNSDGGLTNYTMFQESMTDFYNSSFEVGKIGSYKYKIYFNYSSGNLTDNFEWQTFNVSAPVATATNEVYPVYALPSSSIVVTADLFATDLLNEVNVTLNVPSGFEFPFTSYSQTQTKSNFSALQTKTAKWFVYLPNNETTYIFNITWTDKYNNSWQSSNSELIVTYDATNLTNATNVNVIVFPELEAGSVLESEIQVRDVYGDFVNATSVKISLYDPNDNLVVDSVNYVSQLGTGRYFYNYTTPSTPTGQWVILINVTRDENSFLDRDYFRITGGPFDIRDIAILDDTTPSIQISTILENKGEGTTDIIVNWNLTREDTGALLDSGRDTIGVISEKSYTINPSTTFTGLARITFLGTWSSTEKAGAYKVFTISSETSPTPTPTPSPGGGSSGGGGSVTGRATEEIVCPSFYMRYGKECCLDKNNNSICDKDEEVQKSSDEENKTNAGEGGAQESPSKEQFNFQNILGKLKDSFESSKAYIIKNKTYFIFGVGIFVFLVLVFLVFRIIHKRRQRKRKSKKKKKGIIEINHIKNIQVYAGDGKSIGKVKEAHLEGNKIDGWLIKVKKNISKKIGKKYILVKHNHVSSIGDVMIIDERVSEHLDKYSTLGST